MSEAAPARWLTEADVAGLLDMAEAIGAVRSALRDEAARRAQTMTKTHVGWDVDGAHAGLHAIGAAMPAAGLVGTKTWAHTPGGAQPRLLLFDARTGALRAVIEAFVLGQLRTGAMSGVATEMLAAPETDELAIIGTGRQALPQVAAVAAVRGLSRVRAYGRDPAKARAFAERVESELELTATVAASAAAAVRDAPVVTLVTRATAPVLRAGDVDCGAHVNSVGAITPERAEFEPSLLSRCAVVAADSVEQARELSAELRAYYGDGGPRWDAVSRLSELLAAGVGRPDGADVTLFKSLGIGLADVAVGARCLELAERRDVGAALPASARASPRLRGTRAATETKPHPTRRRHTA